MSLLSGNNNHHKNSDFEYWEFVHCAICFLPFVPDPANPAVPPSVPFWLTECGHTVCNNHLNADQSCRSCGASSIQLVPLQRDMMPPMSGWFRPVPRGLDDIAYAAKFQQENMASLLRFYKRKCTQQHAMINKTKTALAENNVLRSQIEQLQHEVGQLRSAAGISKAQHRDSHRFGFHSDRAAPEAYEPGASLNANGKRPLTDVNQYQRTSSPRSIVTPIPPSRLTLPPDHQPPVFPSATAGARDNPAKDKQQESNARPGSSRFAQYAFHSPETPLRVQALRHVQRPQGHDQRQHDEVQDVHRQVHDRGQKQHQQRMLPPPTPVRPNGTAVISKHQSIARGSFRPAGQASEQRGGNSHMQIPPQSALAPVPHQSHHSSSLRPQPFPMAVPKTASSSSGLHSATNAGGQFQTAPQTPSNRFFNPHNVGRNVPSRAQAFPGMATGGGTRTPFYPGRDGG